MKTIYRTIICLILTTGIFMTGLSAVKSGQVSSKKEIEQKAKAKISKFKKNDFSKYYNNKKRIPDDLPKTDVKARKDTLKDKTKVHLLKKNETITSLVNKYTPGEFDESQAVLISWPSFAYDSVGDLIDEPYYDGYGWKYNIDIGDWVLVTVAGYTIDLFDDSDMPPLYKSLVESIQKECTAWIRVTNPEDTLQLKNWLSAHGVNLTNYMFFRQPEGENSFWMRDCGPFGFYYGNEDSLALLGVEYYPGRPIDDKVSEYLANRFGLPFVKSDVETEGGNFMTDGYGQGFYSNVIYGNNQDTLGFAFQYKKAWTKTQVDSAMTDIFNLSKFNVPNHLNCDGGTGHIDLYLKLIDDETMLMTNYPSQFNNINFPDYQIVANNVTMLKALQSPYQRSFRFVTLPLPTPDNGIYNPRCDSLFYDARTYVNGLIVNKSFLLPIYSNGLSGNSTQDAAAIEQLQKYLPGYTIVPIDARALSTGGGELHCITMQIPAENPVRIWHPSIRDAQLKKDNYNILAVISNRSGIKSADCYWRKNKNVNWNKISLSENSGTFNGNIDGTQFQIGDTIDYYLDVTTNNGKRITKPLPAPSGYFTFRIADPAGIEDGALLQTDITKVYPNPAMEEIKIDFSIGNETDAKLIIRDIFGNQCLIAIDQKMAEDSYTVNIPVDRFASGTYFVELKVGNNTRIAKFNVIR